MAFGFCILYLSCVQAMLVVEIIEDLFLHCESRCLLGSAFFQEQLFSELVSQRNFKVVLKIACHPY